MEPISLSQALKYGAQLLKSSSDSAELDAQLLLLEILNKTHSYLFTWPEKLLLLSEFESYEAMLQRRVLGEPVAFILGYQDFWSIRLKVSTDTLIPRPDTELLVEQALKAVGFKKKRVADLGCGTGAVALALASERPDWQLFASDYVQGAAELAETNRKTLNLDNVTVLMGSWFEPLQGLFDLIVSNPPYIVENDVHLAEGDVRFEPLTALVSKQNGLQDIKHIVESSPAYLNNGAWLMLEHGYDQGVAVNALLVERGFANVSTVQDLNHNDRVTKGQWLKL